MSLQKSYIQFSLNFSKHWSQDQWPYHYTGFALIKTGPGRIERNDLWSATFGPERSCDNKDLSAIVSSSDLQNTKQITCAFFFHISAGLKKLLIRQDGLAYLTITSIELPHVKDVRDNVIVEPWAVKWQYLKYTVNCK